LLLLLLFLLLLRLPLPLPLLVILVMVVVPFQRFSVDGLEHVSHGLCVRHHPSNATKVEHASRPQRHGKR
jgi:hypothetical protein